MTRIPTYVIVRDYLGGAQKALEYFGDNPHSELAFVDIQSTYAPLLEWYEALPSSVSVFRHPYNDGPRAAWRYVKPNAEGHYAVSDGDLDYDGVPDDLPAVCLELLKSNVGACKVGPALRLDDLILSSNARLASSVLDHESQFWKPQNFVEQRVVEAPVFASDIDTTYAVYGTKTCVYGPALRVAGDYQVRHTPWYFNAGNSPPDYQYYLEHAVPYRMGMWTHLNKVELAKKVLNG